MSEHAEALDFASLLPDAPFGELHRRTVDAPLGRVWETLLSLPAEEIRLLSPLFRLRGLPARLIGRAAPSPLGERPALDLFMEEGFTMLRCDEQPSNGRALLIFGAAGRFWMPVGNGPINFDSAEDFLAFAEPGHAKTVARFEAWEKDGQTVLETQTVVDVTDPKSKPKFGAYWAIIRGPSGLLRRSWLAGVDRRACA